MSSSIFFDRGVLPSAEHQSAFAAEATYGNADELLTALDNVTKTYRDGNSDYESDLFETLLRIARAFKNEASQTLAEKQQHLRAIVANEQRNEDGGFMFAMVNAQMCAIINNILGADLFEADAEPMADKKAALNARLLRDGLQVHDVGADGSCQFYALSYALTGRPDGAAELRKNACDEIRDNFLRYRVSFVGETPDVELYLQKMRNPATWGDSITLFAVANILGRPIKVMSAGATDLQILNTTKTMGQPITIGYYSNMHYVGIDEIPNAHPLSFFDQLDDASQVLVQDGKEIVLLPDASLYNKADFLEHATLLLRQCIQTTRSQAKPGWEESACYQYYHELERVPEAKLFYGLMRMKKGDIFFKPGPNPTKIMFVHVHTIWHFANAAPVSD